ncbi:MAG: DUF481 domain-containing protein [Candidatus Zapsychrus exili]|nr:DUF481 domain-containing protein [Candidatus Zapsychrus exili]
MKTVIIILLAAFLNMSVSFAEEINLKNGDRITGNIIEQTDETITIEAKAMGQVVISKSFIIEEKEVVVAIEEARKPVWDKKGSLGYNKSSGNTRSSQLSGEITLDKKTDSNETNIKLGIYTSSANDKMDSKKVYGSLRYAYSFAEDLKWYHFYKLEAEQDRFSNIDYRLIPSSGVGYWFSDSQNFKAMAEGAFGLERTVYRDNTKDDSSVVFIPRGYIEKKLFNNLTFSEDLTLYPSLKDSERYRIHSETSLVNPINDNLAWRLSFIDDFNSNPVIDKKKNDYKIITSIDFNF